MDAGSRLTDCWEPQDEDASGWARKASLPVEWSEDKGMKLGAREEAKPRGESMARGMGEHRRVGCPRRPSSSPVGEERLRASCRPPPPTGLSFPCWYVLGALPYLVAVPSFVSHRVLSTFMDAEIDVQRGRMTCLLSHIS